MKVRNGVAARALVSATLVAAIAATISFSAPLQASAITRSKVIARGRVWVNKRIPYSQSRYYKGYRQDCSGFVSMAWKLNSSYTTRTISSRAKRIAISKLKPGDAVLVPGHVSLFGGWKNKKARTYWALEETTWGSHAKRRVRSIPSNATALRYKGITRPKPKPKPKPKKKPAPAPVAPPSALPTPTVSPIIAPWLDGSAVGVRFVV